MSDESAISTVRLRWSGPGAVGDVAMFRAGSSWEGLLAPAAVNGWWDWEAVATDARGNVGRVSRTVQVVGC